jgi:isoamylase
MEGRDWEDINMRCFGMLMDGRARPTGVRQRGTEATMLLVLNSHYDVVEFTLPVYSGGSGWEAVLDTNVPDNENAERIPSGKQYSVTGRSLLLFALAE